MNRRILHLLLCTFLITKAIANPGNPLSFTENNGQLLRTDGLPASEILFYHKDEATTIFLYKNGISYVFRNPTENSLYKLEMSLQGSRQNCSISADQFTVEHSAYYLPHCPEGITKVRHARKITYHSIYDGIDWVIYFTENNQLKYDFIVHPGADPSAIRMHYADAEHITLADDGSMKIRTSLGEVTEGKPFVYQDDVEIQAGYLVEEKSVQFILDSFDCKKKLVIDPTLDWATFFGGNGNEDFWEIVTDKYGNSYVAGGSSSTNFPVQNAFQSSLAGPSDVIVVKFDPSGNRLWSTYYGGSNTDRAVGIDLYKDSLVAVAGLTESSNFPIANAFQSNLSGSSDNFIIQFDTAGNRIWATYHGGTKGEECNSMAVDINGNIFLTGLTFSSNGISTPGSYRTTLYTSSGWDCFLVKFSMTGARLWGTYFGGTNIDNSRDVDTDSWGNVYVTGETRSQNTIATPGAFQTNYSGPSTSSKYNAFLMKFNPSGTTKLWGTYYGSPQAVEVATSVACDQFGNVFFGGRGSNNLNMANGHQMISGGGREGFLNKFSSTGVRIWSTYAGGSGHDHESGVYYTNNHSGLCTDTSGNVYFTINTRSIDLDMVNAYDSTYAASHDFAIYRYDPSGNLTWSTYYGGTGSDLPMGISVNPMMDIFVTGITASSDIPVLNPWQGTYSGGANEGFVLKFTEGCPHTAKLGNDTTLCSNDLPYQLNPGNYTGTYLWQDSSTSPVFDVSTAGLYWVEIQYGNCVSRDSIQISIAPAPAINLGADTTLCAGDSLSLNAAYPGVTYLWQDSSNGSLFTVTQSGTFWAELDNGLCSARDSIQVSYFPAILVNLGADTTLCGLSQYILNVGIPADSYLWQDSSSGSVLTATTSGLYWVEVIVGACTKTDSINLTFGNFPVVDLGQDTILCFGDSILLNASFPGATYNWSTGASAPAINAGQAGVYWVDVTLGNCTYRDSISISYYPQLHADLGNDTTLCGNSSWLISFNNPGATYLWQDGSGNPSYLVNSPGLYWVEVSSTTCIIRDSVTVLYAPEPVFSLGSDTTLCPGDSIVLTISYPGAAVTWSNGSTDTLLTVSQQGLIWAELQLGSCSWRDSIQILYHPFVPLDLGPDTTLCEQTTMTLDVSHPGADFIWQDNTAGPVYQVSLPGLYWVERELNNCFSRDSILVSYQAIPTVYLGPDTSLCPGDSLQLNAAFPGAAHLWQDNSNSPVLTVSQPGLYWVLNSVGSCIDADSVQIDYLTESSLELGNDTLLCSDHYLLNPGVQGVYLWQDGSSAPTYMVDRSGLYFVAIQTTCKTLSDSIFIHLDCECSIFRPNAFTPNGDGLNDAFITYPACYDYLFEINIFSRWGEVIFSSTDAEDAWDGTFNGTELPEGVYPYVIRFTPASGKTDIISGSVTLIR